jgi:LAO/AO transport system kinase
MPADPLVKGLLAGDRMALAKLITQVESGAPLASDALRVIYPHTGRAIVVGFAGPLGVGKSSLISRLVTFLRKKDLKVGIVAVDPSSPFSGGAVLGDRVRLDLHPGDKGVFVRSMATRGQSGGLSQGTRDTVRLMEAFGMDVVIVETVGSGQTDVNIRDVATSRVVVLVPHLGDDVQSLKAGLFEIADIFAVNKSDLPGSSDAVRHLREMASIMSSRANWKPDVVECSALNGTGLDELWSKIERHEAFVRQDEDARAESKERLAKELRELVSRKFEVRLSSMMSEDSKVRELVERVQEGEVDPYTGSELILGRFPTRRESPRRR